MDMIFSYLQDAMVAMVAAAVCAGIALAALWKLVSDLRGSQDKPECVWRKDAAQPQDGETHWLCTLCGASSLTKDGKPPVACRKQELKLAV